MTDLATCPHCGFELQPLPHCDGRTCGWINCRACASHIDRAGRHICDHRTGCIDPSRRHPGVDA